MDARSFYGQTINRVRINDREGVQNHQEEVFLEVLPEIVDSEEESECSEDEIENLRNDRVSNEASKATFSALIHSLMIHIFCEY